MVKFSKESDSLLKVSIKLGIAVPIFLTIIAVWSYYLLKSAEPTRLTSQGSGSGTSNTAIGGWDPFNTFCSYFFILFITR